MGILAVQIEGDNTISLTIAGKNNEKRQLVFETPTVSSTSSLAATPGPSTSTASSVFDISGTEELFHPGARSVETTRKNIAQYLRQGLSVNQTLLEDKINAGAENNTVANIATNSAALGSPIMQVGNGGTAPPVPTANPIAAAHANMMMHTQPRTAQESFQQEQQRHVPNTTMGHPVSDNAALASLMTLSEFNNSQGVGFPVNSPNGKQSITDKTHSMFSNADVTYSSPLLVNLLKNESLGGHLPGNTFSKGEGEPPRKRKCRPKKPRKMQQIQQLQEPDDNSVKEFEHQSTLLGLEAMNAVSNTLGTVSPSFSNTQSLSMSAASSPGRKSPAAASRVGQKLINPTTGQLEVVGSPRQIATQGPDNRLKADSPQIKNMQQAPVLSSLHPPANPLVALQKRLEHSPDDDAQSLLAQSGVNTELANKLSNLPLQSDIASRLQHQTELANRVAPGLSPQSTSHSPPVDAAAMDNALRINNKMNSGSNNATSHQSSAQQQGHITSIASSVGHRPSHFSPTTPANRAINPSSVQFPPSELTHEELSSLSQGGNSGLPGHPQHQGDIGYETQLSHMHPSRQQAIMETMLGGSTFGMKHSQPSKGNNSTSLPDSQAAIQGNHTVPATIQSVTVSSSTISSLSNSGGAALSAMVTIGNQAVAVASSRMASIGPGGVSMSSNSSDNMISMPHGSRYPIHGNPRNSLQSHGNPRPGHPNSNLRPGLPQGMQNLLPGQSMPGPSMIGNRQHHLQGSQLLANQSSQHMSGLGIMPRHIMSRPGIPGSHPMHPLMTPQSRSAAMMQSNSHHPLSNNNLITPVSSMPPRSGQHSVLDMPGAHPGVRHVRPRHALVHQSLPLADHDGVPGHSVADVNPRPPLMLPPGNVSSMSGLPHHQVPPGDVPVSAPIMSLPQSPRSLPTSSEQMMRSPNHAAPFAGQPLSAAPGRPHLLEYGHAVNSQGATTQQHTRGTNLHGVPTTMQLPHRSATSIGHRPPHPVGVPRTVPVMSQKSVAEMGPTMSSSGKTIQQRIPVGSALASSASDELLTGSGLAVSSPHKVVCSANYMSPHRHVVSSDHSFDITSDSIQHTNVHSPHTTQLTPHGATSLSVNKNASNKSPPIALSTAANLRGHRSSPEVTSVTSSAANVLPHPLVNNIHKRYLHAQALRYSSTPDEMMHMASVVRGAIPSPSEVRSCRNGPRDATSPLSDDSTLKQITDNLQPVSKCIVTSSNSELTNVAISPSIRSMGHVVTNTNLEMSSPCHSPLPTQTAQNDHNLQTIMTCTTDGDSPFTPSSEREDKQSSGSDQASSMSEILTTPPSAADNMSPPSVSQEASKNCASNYDIGDNSHIASQNTKLTHRTIADYSGSTIVHCTGMLNTVSSECKDITSSLSRPVTCDNSPPRHSSIVDRTHCGAGIVEQHSLVKHKQEINGLIDSSTESSRGEPHEGNYLSDTVAGLDSIKSKQISLGDAQSNDVSETMDSCIKWQCVCVLKTKFSLLDFIAFILFTPKYVLCFFHLTSVISLGIDNCMYTTTKRLVNTQSWYIK